MLNKKLMILTTLIISLLAISAVNATDNALTKLNNGEIIPITLERTLSSQDVTVGDIITSAVESFDYTNNVEITGISYKNNTEDDKYVHRDRVRTPKTNNTDNSWMIILAGAQHDTAGSETIAIHPPTGENNNMIYYVVAITSLAVLAVGVVLIKKFAIKKD